MRLATKRQRRRSPGSAVAAGSVGRRRRISVTLWLSSCGIAVAGRPDPPCPPPTGQSSPEKYRRRRRCDLPSSLHDPWGSDLRQNVSRDGSFLSRSVLLCGNNNPGRPSHSAWLQFDNSYPTEESRDAQHPQRTMSNDPDGQSERASYATSDIDDARSYRYQASREEGGDSQSASPNAEPQAIRTPLLYRYYGKSRPRTPGSGSIPFVLLGPNVDHFKLIGQELASRGFSVLACERVATSNNDCSGNGRRTDPKPTGKARQSTPSEGDDESAGPTAGGADPVEDGATLIGELLDALKWNRVVLVGCDAEALTAVQAAVKLAPSGRVAGLVLCGDLKSVQDMILVGDWDVTMNGIRNTNRLMIEIFGIDLLLQDRLQCPFTVVWSGDSPSLPTSQTLSPAETEAFEALLNNRYVILGGGAAPHRRRPELFAWVLTRFVEEKIAGMPAPTRHRPGGPLLQKRGGQQDDDDPPTDLPPAPPEPRPLNRLVRLQEFLSPGSFLVTGRMIATMLFYWSVMKVGIHQFDNICTGMVNVQSAVKHVDSWRAATFRFVGRVLSKIGGLFLITSYTSSAKPADSNVDSAGTGTEQEMVTEGGSDTSIPELSVEDDASTPPGADDSASSDEVPSAPPAVADDDSTPQLDKSEADDDSKPGKEKETRPRLFFLDHVVA